jgi:hypothetical protein
MPAVKILAVVFGSISAFNFDMWAEAHTCIQWVIMQFI